MAFIRLDYDPDTDSLVFEHTARATFTITGAMVRQKLATLTGSRAKKRQLMETWFDQGLQLAFSRFSVPDYLFEKIRVTFIDLDPRETFLGLPWLPYIEAGVLT